MLTDQFLRTHRYLRVSVTDRCNLRCTYCMPPDGVSPIRHADILSYEEIERLIDIFAAQGVEKVRFTGGEPLVRRGFLDLVRSVRGRQPGLELCLTTNGMLLEGAVPDLHALGVRKINVSLDTLKPDRFRAITGVDGLDAVVRAIDRAAALVDMEVKINVVLFEETLAELDDLLSFAADRDVTLRFIERMPLSAGPGITGFLPAVRLMEALAARGPLERDDRRDTTVALMYRLTFGDGSVRIGVIPPVTARFCAACNRVRLTADGRLMTCLHSGQSHDLRGLVRGGADDEAIAKEIRRAVLRKNEGHTMTCSPVDGGCTSLESLGPMSRIGG